MLSVWNPASLNDQNFTIVVVGRPAKGKTWLIRHLLDNVLKSGATVIEDTSDLTGVICKGPTIISCQHPDTIPALINPTHVIVFQEMSAHRQNLLFKRWFSNFMDKLYFSKALYAVDQTYGCLVLDTTNGSTYLYAAPSSELL